MLQCVSGKSTCAGVVARACGYEVVEYNASDVRSKKNLDEEVGELIGTHGLTEFFSSARNVKHVAKKTVLIMDEVDVSSTAFDCICMHSSMLCLSHVSSVTLSYDFHTLMCCQCFM